MTVLYTPAVIANVSDELAMVAVGCQKFGLICTEPAEFNKYTAVIGLFGMIVGMISILLFQYTRRKTKKRLEKEQLAEREEYKEAHK